MSVDFTKPVQTRDGHPVRILCTDRMGEHPVVGLVADPGGEEDCLYWYPNGRFFPKEDYRLDLVNVPVKKEGWVRLYKGNGRLHPGFQVYETKEQADAGVLDRCNFLGMAKVEWEE